MKSNMTDRFVSPTSHHLHDHEVHFPALKLRSARKRLELVATVIIHFFFIIKFPTSRPASTALKPTTLAQRWARLWRKQELGQFQRLTSSPVTEDNEEHILCFHNQELWVGDHCYLLIRFSCPQMLLFIILNELRRLPCWIVMEENRRGEWVSWWVKWPDLNVNVLDRLHLWAEPFVACSLWYLCRCSINHVTTIKRCFF